ncbi:hypothetical protein VTK56DRAFT_3631 [Thermocarpiscus australiensis]
MKLSLAITLLVAALAEGHPSITQPTGNMSGRRHTTYQSNGAVTDVNNDQIRCYERFPGQGPPGIYNVTAGQVLNYDAKASISHPGPWLFTSPKSLKARQRQLGTPRYPISNLLICLVDTGARSIPVTIPRRLQHGDYLLRAEHIALHSASTAGGAQFYLSCAQITVSGGSGTYSPLNLVSFPGAYKATDPGIVINIYYPVLTSYTAPGPPAQTC